VSGELDATGGNVTFDRIHIARDQTVLTGIGVEIAVRANVCAERHVNVDARSFTKRAGRCVAVQDRRRQRWGI
jgi:hypothetical protein